MKTTGPAKRQSSIQRSGMDVTGLDLVRLLSFSRTSLSFCPGINVLIGENSTGKTNVLKLIYSALRAVDAYQAPVPTEQGARPAAHITTKLTAVFRPDDDQVGRLVQRTVGQSTGSMTLRWGKGDEFWAKISTRGKVNRRVPKGKPPQAIFLPSREVLAMYQGFMAAYENRELSFDETYYDLCKAMSAGALRGARGEKAAELIHPLLSVLKGRIVLKGDRFYLASNQGKLEAPLLSEGFRKLGALAHLISNGSLSKNGILLWDEPEASLNPRVVTIVAKMLQTLARNGIQVFIATHDFLLSQELSLAAEYDTEQRVPIRFIGLARDSGGRITSQEADTLPELKDNPILKEFAAHYDREQLLFSGLKPIE